MPAPSSSQSPEDSQLASYIKGLLRGLGPDLVGGPVDLSRDALNLGIGGVNLAGGKLGLLEKPLPTIQPGAFGDSDWWAKLTNVPDDSTPQYTAGRLTPLGVSAAGAGLQGAKRLVNALLSRSAPSRSGPIPGPKDQLGAITWHGSPYQFDKFDSSKLGTGEGAQAFGQGTYLAEAPEVARNYAYKLTSAEGGPVRQNLDSLVPVNRGASVADVLQSHEPEIGRLRGLASAGDEKAARTLANLEKRMERVKQHTNIYEVDIPDEAVARMMRWDSGLKEQPDVVKNALKMYKGEDWVVRNMARSQNLGEELIRVQKNPGFFAEAMRDYGVPGIKYFDGISRGVGNGTANLVVFPGNEDLLKILRRYSDLPQR